jgi:predicted signal transduction protein with EAL and GGDEF domain
MSLLLAVGALGGLAAIAAADRLSRSNAARTFLSLLSLPEFAIAAAVVVLDGGVMSPLALGMLAPLPLVAFSARPMRAAPVVAGVLATYVAIGLLARDASGWYVTMWALGALTLAVACSGMGVDGARRRAQLTRLSRVDSLTGALNRRGFEESFTAVPDRSMIIFDLDNVKQLNDTQGHEAGDELLEWVATTLRAGLGPDDVIARLGGDEFVVLTAGVTARRRPSGSRPRSPNAPPFRTAPPR